jgi:hypothetical protein
MTTCECCVFRAVQNCPLLHFRPFNIIYWDEKLINIRHVENDLKVYNFYRKVFERTNELPINETPTLFSGDRLLKFTRYYVYCYDYHIQVMGERVIFVGVFDRVLCVFATAKITCGVYPRRQKRGKQKYLNTHPLRVTVEMERCTTLNVLYNSVQAKAHIEIILDEVITFFFHEADRHEDGLQRNILERVGVCVSLRLTQLLKYAVQLQLMVKKFCYSNCTCGGLGNECICARPYSCLETLNEFAAMRCFLPPLSAEDKELQRLERTLKWRVSGYQIFYYDRLYANVDYWLYETQCELDEPNRIICFYTTLKRLEGDNFAHCLCSYTIKYGYDESKGGHIYKRSVQQTMEFQHCEHDVTVFLGYQTKYRGIFQHLFCDRLTRVGKDIVDVNDSRVVEGVEMCSRLHGVLISQFLVYKMLIYLQRMMRVRCNAEIVCCQCSGSICKCISREATEKWP